jgi:peptidase E
MSSRRGMIAIMGSGETTDSMARVHRYLLAQLPHPVRAAFIDTPAGFQMNADDLFDKAQEYFEKRFNQPMERASFKSSKQISPSEAERAFQTLRQADYIFVGPGSPTYALKNWAGTPIPQILLDRVQSGGCFIAASAAALTLGRFTLPVYEIYKVGEELHWAEGLNLLGKFGLNLVVIPHWNNAEGGTHDTRFCYMGEPRLLRLESLLPPEIPILGIDEHTACILDFQAEQVFIKGIGGVTLRHREIQKTFKDGQILPLAELQRFTTLPPGEEFPPAPQVVPPRCSQESFGERVQSIKESFDSYLKNHQGAALADVLVGLDKMIWKSCKEFEEEEVISQTREAFREMIVRLGLEFEATPTDIHSILSPLLKIFLEVRGKLRSAKQWKLADEMRDKLFQIGIIVEDTPEGPRWRLKAEPKEQSL